jgi:hypothetical protein
MPGHLPGRQLDVGHRPLGFARVDAEARRIAALLGVVHRFDNQEVAQIVIVVVALDTAQRLGEDAPRRGLLILVSDRQGS